MPFASARDSATRTPQEEFKQQYVSQVPFEVVHLYRLEMLEDYLGWVL